MLAEVIQGCFAIFDLKTLPFLLVGIPVGLIIGILPGIGGLAGLAIIMPFIYGMDPGPALAFLLAFHSVCATGGSVTSILLSIPGEEINAATLIDGYPMTQKGLAGRALGAALVSSSFGGVLGGIILIILVYAVRPIVMAFGLPGRLMINVLFRIPAV